MDYFHIDIELSEQLRSELLEFAHTAKWVSRYGSNSSDYMNLDACEVPEHLAIQVTDLFKIKPNFVALTRIKAFAEVPPHIDTCKDFDRNTVIMFPLQPYNKNYAPYNAIEAGELVHFTPCFAAATSHIHSVKNNQFDRINLQLSYEHEIEDIHAYHSQGLLVHAS